MMIAGLAGLVLLAIALPHLLPLRQAEPTAAVVLWSASLTLRALLGLFIALWVVLYLPASELFQVIAHWCWHGVVPLVTSHLDFSGHSVADAAIVLPALLLAASLTWVSLGVWRVARAVQRMVATARIGTGPRDSIIVGGAEVLVAAAGFTRPQIVVSAGALVQLDDEELAAALEHECGHIVRRHRFLLMHAEACRALGRFVPGTRHAVRELGFQLERDADSWALRRHDRFALASAILKAASSRTDASLQPALALLSGSSNIEARLGELVHKRPPSRLTRAALRGLAGFVLVLTIGMALSVPPTIAAGLDREPVTIDHPCPS